MVGPTKSHLEKNLQSLLPQFFIPREKSGVSHTPIFHPEGLGQMNYDAREVYRRSQSPWLHPGISAAFLQFHLIAQNLQMTNENNRATSLMSLIQGKVMQGLGAATAPHKRRNPLPEDLGQE